MRFAVLGVFLPLVLGCAGKNVVAGSEKTKAEQLEAAVPSWCETTCDKLKACPSAMGCDCSGDVCDCSSVGNNCVEQCQKAMAAFTQGDDLCASVGERFRQCVDVATCDKLQNGDACTPTAAERDACPAPNASEPSGSSSGGPGVGSDGTGSGTAGTASTDNPPSMGPGTGGGTGVPSMTPGTSAPTGPVVSCMGAWGAGGGTPAEPMQPSSSVVCEEGVGGCSDGHEYSWLCAEGSQQQTACSCLVDSRVTGGFDPGAPTCPTRAQVNAGCGWNLEQ
jgi:hypothetical protein